MGGTEKEAHALSQGDTILTELDIQREQIRPLFQAGSQAQERVN